MKGLEIQCRKMDLPFVDVVSLEDVRRHSLVLDAVFGFSFKGDLRAPFDALLPLLNSSGVPIAAIDIPSGWDVEAGNVSGRGLDAALLVSLTAPKLCARFFPGRHFLGGRFVPPVLAAKYDLQLPPFPGTECVVEL
jgi:NAD(P)H-hydrate epimerase